MTTSSWQGELCLLSGPEWHPRSLLEVGFVQHVCVRQDYFIN